ncbi:MAG: protein jag [Treponema sp.]|nr:protein jag [Treponema sp.]
MQGEIIKTGRTVEDAINLACQELGCEREECQWEIIDLPKRGFLGLRNTPAKVRVSIDRPQSQPQSRPQAPAKAPPPKQPERRRPEAKRDTSPPPAKPAQQAKPVAAQPVITAELSEEYKERAQVAGEYLTGILQRIDLPGAQVETLWEDEGACLRINGDGLGVIIGRRGETLDALQYLCSLAANRARDGYLRITVDCGDYRIKRKATLEALAKKLSAQAAKTGANRTLEPMNPFERRIIHAIVSEIEGVSSTSVGEEPNRRVVITTGKNARRAHPPRERDQSRSGSGGRAPVTDRPSWPDKGAKGDRPDERGASAPRRGAPRGRPGERGGRSGPGGRDRRERPPAYQPVKEPDVPPSEAEDKPLYGKIDLE